jgi:hypothetical protein
MLSQRKMQIGKSSIDFQEMNIKDGQIMLQSHIGETLNFPSSNISKKEVE